MWAFWKKENLLAEVSAGSQRNVQKMLEERASERKGLGGPGTLWCFLLSVWCFHLFWLILQYLWRHGVNQSVLLSALMQGCVCSCKFYASKFHVGSPTATNLGTVQVFGGSWNLKRLWWEARLRIILSIGHSGRVLGRGWYYLKYLRGEKHHSGFNLYHFLVGGQSPLSKSPLLRY